VATQGVGAQRGPHDPGRRAGRFYTARGPMPPSAWLRYPAVWLRARLGRMPERPWLVPAAIGWLRRRIRPGWSILELGSGRSTLWFAHRAGRVISLEDNDYWAQRAAEQVGEAGLEVDLRVMPVAEFPSHVASLPTRSFDLVVVDFLEAPEASRVDALRPARDKVRPGGYLLLDDSDRPGYAQAYDLLGGWRERRFVGIKDEWPEACETTIFQRPG
jgi:SAM-dependent methyltransferase